MLFKSSEIEVPEIKTDTAPLALSEQVTETVLKGSTEVLFEHLYKGNFEEGECISYMSNGNWSMYHLAEYIISRIAPCDLYIATWSISELSARMLCKWLDEGKIRTLVGLFDYRSKNRHPAAFHLAKHRFSKVKVALCHAKVSVFVSTDKTRHISLNGSPNWTENPRIESGVVLCSQSTAEGHIKWITEMINKGAYELD